MPKAAAKALVETFARATEHVDENQGMAGVNPGMLEALAKPFHCQWATFWKVDAKKMQLYPAAVWHENTRSTDILDRDTLQRRLSMSEGTAGHVWRLRKPVWSTNIILDMCLPRSLEADSVGLHAGVWFAVKTDTAVYGVVEMLARTLEPAAEDILIVIEQLGVSLGWLMETAHMRNLGK
jgi:hypothetical protein